MSGKEKKRKLFEHQNKKEAEHRQNISGTEAEKKQKKLAREKERFGLGPLR